MKPLKIPLFVVGMLAPFLLTAQSLHLTGSNPANQSADVALYTTITFQFDQALQPETVFLDSIGERYLVIPHDKITIHSQVFAPDYRSVTFTVTHQAGVDYTWAFFGLRSATGAGMSRFNLVSYTTAPSWSPASVSGRLTLQDPAAGEDFQMGIVMLLSDLSFMNGEEGNGPEEEMLYAVLPDALTGEYVVPGVKPGTYYPLAMNFVSFASREMDPVRFGLWIGPDGEPAPIFVGQTSLSGVNLTMVPMEEENPEPLEATAAVALADAAMQTIDPDALAIRLEGRTAYLEEGGDPLIWEIAYFADADSMLTMIQTDGRNIFSVQSMHYLQLEPEERLEADLSTIKFIPKPFFPSRMAFHMAMANGMMNDIQERISQPGVWMELTYVLSHFYEEYPDLVGSGSNPFWQIRLKAENQVGHFESIYLFDAVTGVFIGRKERSEIWNRPVLSVMSSDPSALTANVPLQATIRISFNEPIRPETFSLETRMQTWMVLPADRVTVNHISYTDYNRTVVLDVTQTPDTDVVWAVYGVISQEGGTMTSAHPLNYTTSYGISPVKVEGSLGWPEGMTLPPRDQLTTVVVLLDTPDYFLQQGMEGPPPGIRNVGSMTSEGWAYSVANVRPGLYYPAAFVLSNGMEGNHLIAAGFLPDNEGRPRAIQVGETSLNGIDIRLFDVEQTAHQPVDISEVVDVIRAAVNAQGNGAVLLTLWGREEVHRPDPPSGRSYDWGFVFYESATDTVEMVQAHSGGIFAVDRFHISSIPEEERMPADLVQPLPGEFIGSGHALNTALTNGLSQLIQFAPNDAWMQVRYELNRFYFLYPGLLNADSPPFWRIQFNAERWGSGDQLLWSQEALYLVDATNGALIHQTVSTGLDESDAPSAIRLEQNYPNPFNPSTVIGFQLSVVGQARLVVYDVLGREVAVLVDGWMPAGRHSVTFDASDLPSGVYLYRLVAGGQTMQRKLTLIR